MDNKNLKTLGGGLLLCSALFFFSACTEKAEEKEDQILEPIPFQRGALWMGVFIIFCAAALKHLHY